MKNILVAVLMALLWIPAAFAQSPTQTIRGKVIDRESKMPLFGANIAVMGTQPLIGASTDAEGNFRIEKVPVGRQTLRITYLGYENTMLNEVLISSGKEVMLKIEMTESILEAEGVTVVATQEKDRTLNEMTSVSARMFTVEETKRYAASINDPARMAQSFAGVASSGDDGSNEIVIRGNSPMGLLWRLEGIEIPNPNHFANTGSSGGGVSILSAQMLANSDFITGAFAAEYGNAYSGVFDIKLRQGNNEKREYALQAGVLGVDFATEGPFSKKYNGSYLVNYRYSSLALLSLMGVKVAGASIPKFQDLSFKIQLPTKKAGIFSIWGIGGLSGSADKTPKNSFDFRSNMGVAGVSHIAFINANTYIETVVSASASQSKYIEEQYDKPALPQLVYQENMVNKAVRGTVLFNKKIDKRNTFRAGTIVSLPSFNLFSEGENEGTIKRYHNSQGSTALVQGYAQWKHRLGEKVTLNTGVHYTYFFANGKQAVEPRAGLRWQADAKNAFSFGYGKHSRLYDMSLYFAQRLVGDRFYQVNKNLDLLQAHHLVLGYDRLLAPSLRLKAETYYQYLTHIPIAPKGVKDPEWLAFSGINQRSGFTTDSLVSDGTGYNYGLEITLEKFFTNNYYFLVTTSLFESKYKGRDGIVHDTRFNIGHILNVLGGKEFKVGKNGKSNLLGFNIRAVWMGGNRYTPIDLASSQAEGKAVYHWDKAYQSRVSDYVRMDFRVSYRRNRTKWSSILSLDLQNATNHRNVYTQYFDKDTKNLKTAYQLGLLPVLSYKVEF